MLHENPLVKSVAFDVIKSRTALRVRVTVGLNCHPYKMARCTEIEYFMSQADVDSRVESLLVDIDYELDEFRRVHFIESTTFHLNEKYGKF